ncbi:hypothetical protein LCGC14_0385940 [marine sediment metagenome]|uniref:Uncharacterized protein n=1 Tax=marine sediment metagenome TaxID=412755 RepID=A0A0F9T0T7_9ZZZZ
MSSSSKKPTRKRPLAPYSLADENLLDTYGNLFIGLRAGDLDRELFL